MFVFYGASRGKWGDAVVAVAHKLAWFIAAKAMYILNGVGTDQKHSLLTLPCMCL